MLAQDYKGYKVVVKWGVGFEILKEYRGKYFELSKQNFHFNSSDKALERACNYIDQYTTRLEEKFKSAFIDFCDDVHADPLYYCEHFPSIDVKYYLSAYRKLRNG